MFAIKNGILINYTEEKGITDVVIPYGVTSIGNYAFRGCTNLKSIVIPDSVTRIDECTFFKCTGLENITIPDSVTSIGNYAFRGCTNLKSITIPDNVTSIGGDAFKDCINLKSITISDNVTNIRDWAFFNCAKLKSIIIPNNITNIGSCAFYGCTNLKSITIPDSVTRIDIGAFYQCKKLTSRKANYKAFQFQTGKLKCRGLEYREGEWSEEITDISICERGYHFCDNLFAIFNYYSGEIDKDIVIYECEVGEKIETDGIKYVTNKIKPVKRLYRSDVIKILNNIN